MVRQDLSRLLGARMQPGVGARSTPCFISQEPQKCSSQVAAFFKEPAEGFVPQKTPQGVIGSLCGDRQVGSGCQESLEQPCKILASISEQSSDFSAPRRMSLFLVSKAKMSPILLH